MALSLQSISSVARVRAPRILLLGVEKVGKTSFACGCHFEDGKRTAEGINSPIVIPIKGEEGSDDMSVASFPTLDTFDRVLEAIGVLHNEEHEYRTAVVDSISALEPLAWDAVCRTAGVSSIEEVGGGYGKGHAETASLFRTLLEGLDAIRAKRNMATILIAHVKVKRFDDPGGDSYDRYQLDVNDRIGLMLARWADLILFAGSKVAVRKEDAGFGKTKARGIDVSGGRRFLFTQGRPAHPGGGRGIYGQLPYELPLDWQSFEAAVSEAQDGTVKS